MCLFKIARCKVLFISLKTNILGNKEQIVLQRFIAVILKNSQVSCLFIYYHAFITSFVLFYLNIL